jgi:hypothetical protein
MGATYPFSLHHLPEETLLPTTEKVPPTANFVIKRPPQEQLQKKE